MVKLIQTIDALCRARGGDVMFLAMLDDRGRPARGHPALGAAMDWLAAQGIGWEVCAAFQRDGLHLEGGPRVLCLDAPYRPGSALLAALEARFERADGSPRDAGLILTLLPLAEAMTNAEQDAPGFWDHP